MAPKKLLLVGIGVCVPLVLFGVARDLASWRPRPVKTLKNAHSLSNRSNFAYVDIAVVIGASSSKSKAASESPEPLFLYIDFQSYQSTQKPKGLELMSGQDTDFSWDRDAPKWHDLRNQTEVTLKNFPPNDAPGTFSWHTALDRKSVSFCYWEIIWTFGTHTGELKRRTPLEKRLHNADFEPQFSADNSRLLISFSSHGNNLPVQHTYLVNAQTGGKVADLGEEYLDGFTFSPAGKWCVQHENTDTSSDSFQLFDSQTGKQKWKKSINWLAISVDDSLIAIPQGDHCEVLEASTGKLVRTLPGPNSTAKSVIWSPDGTRLWSLDNEGHILDWRAS